MDKKLETVDLSMLIQDYQIVDLNFFKNYLKLENRFSAQEIKEIAKVVEDRCKEATAAINVEDIQDFVENEIMVRGKFAVAKEYNYRPNLLARGLNHGRTMSLGVVTINVENPFFVQSLNVINKEADKKGYFTNINIFYEFFF